MCTVTSRQTNSSKAGLIRAELALSFYVSAIPISLWTALLCPAPHFLFGHANRNNTKMKHRASSVLLSSALYCYLSGRGPKVALPSETIKNIGIAILKIK